MPRRAANLSVDEALLREARELDVNISRAAEAGIAAEVAKARAERWKAENAEAIEGWNAYVEANGLPLAKYRMF